MATNSVVNVRFATLRDIPRLAHICITSMGSDPVFDYVYCYRDVYPDDHVFFWQQRLKNDLYDPSVSFLVAEVPRESPSGRSAQECDNTEVIAFATWTLKGPCLHGKEVLTWREHAIAYFMRTLNKIEGSFIRRMYGWRRDGDFQRREGFLRMGTRLNEDFYDPFKCSYHLEILCTIPQHRRKGAATALIKWAIDNASKDGAVVGTEPSDEAAEFYRNRGFVNVGQLAVTNPAEPGMVLEVPVARYSPGSEVNGRASWQANGHTKEEFEGL